MQFNMPDLAIVFPGEIFLSGKRNSDGNLGGRDKKSKENSQSDKKKVIKM